MCEDVVLDVIIQFWQFRRGGISLTEGISSCHHIQYLCWYSWSLCRPVGMWCDAALSRTVRKILSSLWQYVGRERLLSAVSTSYLYMSQSAFFRLTLVRRRPGMKRVFICNQMRIGRWSELSVDSGCQEHEVMREVNANETSGELGSAFGGTLVGLSQS